MENKGVSVIIPAFNQQSFLKRAIQSVFKQDFNNWEIIIINDGSTDGTKYIIDKFIRNSHVKCIDNELNRGLGYSLNKGLETAKYDYIAYLPADDIFFSSHLSSLYAALENNADAIMAYSGLKYDYRDTSNPNAF